MVENRHKSAKLDTGRELGHLRPGSAAELGQRIREVVGLFENRPAAARVAGVSKGQMTRYVTGETSKVPLEPLLQLCEAKGVRIEWLATGRGPMLEADAVAEERARYQLPETFQERVGRLQEVNETIEAAVERLRVRASEGILGRIQAVAFAAGLEEDAVDELVGLVDQAYEEGWDAGHATPLEPDYDPEEDMDR